MYPISILHTLSSSYILQSQILWEYDFYKLLELSVNICHFTFSSSVLMDRNPQTGDHQDHASFILAGSRGFDPDAFKRLIDDHVILSSDDDDLYYVENSAAYVM